jgi:prolyl-tRNA synthetase
MLDVYETFASEHLAVPVLSGRKSAGERFPGAVDTLCIEAMVQDCKAVQAGTSHFLGQNFAKASGIQYLSREGRQEHAWTTSWGVSTRLIGTLIMAHADDDGLVLPPRVAPTQVVIIPVIPKEELRDKVLDACRTLAEQINAVTFAGLPVRAEVDARDVTGGNKTWEWIKKGAPLRVEIGPRDLDAGTVFVGRRDKGPKEKQSYPNATFATEVPALLQSIHEGIYQRALEFRDAHTRTIDSKDEFYAWFTPKNPDKPEIHGGFALAHWNGSPEVEAQIKEDLKVTIRCIPFEEKPEPSTCIFTGEPSTQRVVFAKSY